MSTGQAETVHPLVDLVHPPAHHRSRCSYQLVGLEGTADIRFRVHRYVERCRVTALMHARSWNSSRARERGCGVFSSLGLPIQGFFGANALYSMPGGPSSANDWSLPTSMAYRIQIDYVTARSSLPDTIMSNSSIWFPTVSPEALETPVQMLYNESIL